MDREIPLHLPESKKRGFWGKDAEQIVCKPVKVEENRKHLFEQRGNVAVCRTCSLKHAVYLRKNQEVRDGKIVKKKMA